MDKGTGGEYGREVGRILAEFNRSWMTYWDTYVELQNQLYEAIKTAREVSWLGATDSEKLSEVNRVQRELFASMPRRMDYMPLGQIAEDYDSAASKLEELENALSVQKAKCEKLEQATEELKAKARKTEEDLLRAKSR